MVSNSIISQTHLIRNFLTISLTFDKYTHYGELLSKGEREVGKKAYLHQLLCRNYLIGPICITLLRIKQSETALKNSYREAHTFISITTADDNAK